MAVVLTLSYVHWLLGISAAFILLERLSPWRKDQSVLRPAWLRDVGFVALNGHVFSPWTAALTGAAALWATKALRAFGLQLEGSPAPTSTTPTSTWGSDRWAAC